MIPVALLTVITTVLVTELLGNDFKVPISVPTGEYTAAGRRYEGDRIPARRVCYYQAGSLSRPGNASFAIEDIPGDLCSHVVYAFASLSERTWEIESKKPGFDLDQGGYDRFVGLKKTYEGLRTTISIGGWGDDGSKYSQMASLPERREIFVRSVVAFLKQYGFDGLDIDWEYPGDENRGGSPEDKANFPMLLQELRTAFDAEQLGWELTVAATSTRSKVEKGYDVAKICNAVDAVYLMTYNLRGLWNNQADVHSMLYSRPDLDTGNKLELTVDGGARMWEDMGCPSNRIVIGAPFYGKSYTLCDPSTHDLHAPIQGVGSPGPILGTEGVLMYYEICYLLKEHDWVQDWDSDGLVPFAYSGDQWVGYEDPESLTIKMNYIRTRNYLGAMNWAVNDDDFRGICGFGTFPMMSAIYAGLKDHAVSQESGYRNKK